MPLLFVVLAAALAQVMVAVDGVLDGERLPLALRTTVDSARDLMGTVATATITVAGVAFSISLLVVQLASNQYSPRVLQTFFRDTFTKRVLGIVLGVFTYSLLALRAVRGPIEEGGEEVIPHLTVLLGLVLGVVAILAIVAFINHSAHSMSADDIIWRIAGETRALIRRVHPDREEASSEPAPAVPEAPDEALLVPATRDGWVQQVEPAELLDAVPDGGTVLLHVRPGGFVVEGLPLCTLWPVPPEDEARHAAREEVWGAIRLGASRTMQQDPEFGIRQLVDVALRALSPSENDPTTAEQVIEHLAAVMKELLTRDLPPMVHRGEEGRTLFRLADPDHGELVDGAYDQIRRAAAAHPTVLVSLLRSLGPVVRFLEGAGLPERAALLREKARDAVEGVEREVGLRRDAEAVRAVAERQALLAATTGRRP